jgi:tetratricopeptide (TPR) repeat protein
MLVGRCYKGLGDYDNALNFLEQAIRFKREDAEVLAEVADINALLAETKAAKALFKEAFFLDPAKVDMQFMESDLILKLHNQVAALGYTEDEICEWIPVYGFLWGVFCVKRELKQVEVGRLKQSIFSLEAESSANPDTKGRLKPRLLNRYFWLIDYYETNHESHELIEEILFKIKVIDPEIYKMYTR